MQNMSTVPTTPVVTTVPQSQVQIDPSTLKSQVSIQEVQVPQVVVQQPLVSGVQQQP